MNIQLVTPAPLRINNGNRITALRWAAILKKLGHRVRVTQSWDDRPCDALIALHARRSADSIRRFHEIHPEQPLIVVLTGLPRVAPFSPSRRIRRATVQRATSMPSRFNCRQTLRMP